jgi:hypothetical protein
VIPAPSLLPTSQDYGEGLACAVATSRAGAQTIRIPKQGSKARRLRSAGHGGGRLSEGLSHLGSRPPTDDRAPRSRRRSSVGCSDDPVQVCVKLL